MKIFCLALIVLVMQTAFADAVFIRHPNVAQYGGSDYMNVVQVERGITLDEAFQIADSNPEIDYFVYLKGWQMVLCAPEGNYDETNDPFGLVTYTRFTYDSGSPGVGYCRIFRHGDTVFFKKEGMWLGSATGLADTFIKN